MVKIIVGYDSAELRGVLDALPYASVIDVDEPFERVVDALLPAGQVPGPGFLEQARRNATDREQFLRTHGAMTAEQVAEFAGSRASNRRQTAYRWRSEGSVFAVERADQLLFPGFQFDASTLRPRPGVKQTLARLPRHLTGWALALWWDTPLLLGGQWVAPVELLDESERLLAAADEERTAWAIDGAA